MTRFDQEGSAGNGSDPFEGVPDLDERLADWVDGMMSGRDRERFEAEMRVSPTLRKQVEEYEQSVASIRAALGAETKPVDLADRVMAGIAQEAQRPSPPVRSMAPYLWATTCAAALLGVAVMINNWGLTPTKDQGTELAANHRSENRGVAPQAAPTPVQAPAASANAADGQLLIGAVSQEQDKPTEAGRVVDESAEVVAEREQAAQKDQAEGAIELRNAEAETVAVLEKAKLEQASKDSPGVRSLHTEQERSERRVGSAPVTGAPSPVSGAPVTGAPGGPGAPQVTTVRGPTTGGRPAAPTPRAAAPGTRPRGPKGTAPEPTAQPTRLHYAWFAGEGAQAAVVPMITIQGLAQQSEALQSEAQQSKNGTPPSPQTGSDDFYLGTERPLAAAGMKLFFASQMSAEERSRKQGEQTSSLEGPPVTRSVGGLRLLVIGPRPAASPSGNAVGREAQSGSGAAKDGRGTVKEVERMPVPGKVEAAGGDYIERDWLITGSQAEVRSLLAELRRYTVAQDLGWRSGEARVAWQTPAGGYGALAYGARGDAAKADKDKASPPASTRGRAERAAEKPKQPADAGGDASANQPPAAVQRVVIRFRARR